MGIMDTSVSYFAEAQIVAMTNYVEKFSMNLAQQTRSGKWYMDFGVKAYATKCFPWRSVCVMRVDCEIFHRDHDASTCLLFQPMIRKNVSIYYKIYTSTTHDNKDWRLIEWIYDKIEIGVCQTNVENNSKDDGHHYEECTDGGAFVQGFRRGFRGFGSHK
ncbi:hypothetical protein KI387_039224, partial [Taxus chinensis]